LKATQVSLGAACHSDQQFAPSRILLAMGIANEVACNALRVSVGRETNLNDIDVVLEDLLQAVTVVRLFSLKI
jgi:cysteine sulfinate desulfinase/cysteine desulfurase-like protein